MKRCSQSLVRKALQIQTMRYHNKPNRMAKPKTSQKTTPNLTISNADKNVEQVNSLSYAAGGHAKWYSNLDEQLSQFLV